MFYRGYLPAMALSEGFMSAELLQLSDPEFDLVMLIRFDSTEKSTAWRESASHQQLKPDLKALYHSSDLQVFKEIIQG